MSCFRECTQNILKVGLSSVGAVLCLTIVTLVAKVLVPFALLEYSV